VDVTRTHGGVRSDGEASASIAARRHQGAQETPAPPPPSPQRLNRTSPRQIGIWDYDILQKSLVWDEGDCFHSGIPEEFDGTYTLQDCCIPTDRDRMEQVFREPCR